MPLLQDDPLLPTLICSEDDIIKEKQLIIKNSGQLLVFGLVLLSFTLVANYTLLTNQSNQSNHGTYSNWCFYIVLFLIITTFSSAMAVCHYNIELKSLNRGEVVVV